MYEAKARLQYRWGMVHVRTASESDELENYFFFAKAHPPPLVLFGGFFCFFHCFVTSLSCIIYFFRQSINHSPVDGSTCNNHVHPLTYDEGARAALEEHKPTEKWMDFRSRWLPKTGEQWALSWMEEARTWGRAQAKSSLVESQRGKKYERKWRERDREKGQSIKEEEETFHFLYFHCSLVIYRSALKASPNRLDKSPIKHGNWKTQFNEAKCASSYEEKRHWKMLFLRLERGIQSSMIDTFLGRVELSSCPSSQLNFSHSFPIFGKLAYY